MVAQKHHRKLDKCKPQWVKSKEMFDKSTAPLSVNWTNNRHWPPRHNLKDFDHTNSSHCLNINC